jgi:hypothetical protein
MKNRTLINSLLAIVFLTILLPGNAKSQVVAIKTWTGTYPEMNEKYPLTFIAFTGWLIPIPHVFIRTWPTHYYFEVGAVPVTDATEIAGKVKTGLLRIVAKMLERSQMKGRHEETVLIKDNTDFQKQIEEQIFNAQTDQLEDLYQLAERFIQLYTKVDRLGDLQNSTGVKVLFEKESDQLLMRFLMVNLFQSEHGDKLHAFSEINTTLNKLLGEVDYTFSKIYFFSNYKEVSTGYSFLTQ